MKKFFKIDGAARCQRLDGFEELETHLRALFSTSDSSSSTVELEYLLANWDFDSWLKDCGVKRHLAGISYDNVFRYKYDPSSWAHGCVKVTYKDRLSRQRSKDGLDCEWGPLRQVKGSDGVIRPSIHDTHVPRRTTPLSRDNARLSFEVARPPFLIFYFGFEEIAEKFRRGVKCIRREMYLI
jgi:hypothetical protein